MVIRYILDYFKPAKIHKFKKLPNKIFLISEYEIPRDIEVQKLISKYKLNPIIILEKKENGKFFCSSNLGHENLPDLIIYCSDKLEFSLEQPEILYKAEIIHSRYCFSENLLKVSLNHFSKTVINEGS